MTARISGTAARRNLGIIDVRCGNIAFLDIDDYYLPDGFSVASKIMDAHKGIEGLCKAVGTHFPTGLTREVGNTLSFLSEIEQMTTRSEQVSPVADGREVRGPAYLAETLRARHLKPSLSRASLSMVLAS